MVPKDDSGLSVSKTVYGSPLTVLEEFLGSLELPPTSFLCKIENAVTGFAIPLPHHVRPSPPHQLLPALLMAKLFLCSRMPLFPLWLLCIMNLIGSWSDGINTSTSNWVPEQTSSL